MPGLGFGAHGPWVGRTKNDKPKKETTTPLLAAAAAAEKEEAKEPEGLNPGCCGLQ